MYGGIIRGSENKWCLNSLVVKEKRNRVLVKGFLEVKLRDYFFNEIE